MYFVQSKETTMSPENDCCELTTAEDDVQQEIVGFDDAHAGVDMDLRYDMSYLRGDTSQGADLAGFLRRPVNIYQKDWTLGGTLDFASSQFKPWHLFFNHPAIKKKIG